MLRIGALMAAPLSGGFSFDLILRCDDGWAFADLSFDPAQMRGKLRKVMPASGVSAVWIAREEHFENSSADYRFATAMLVWPAKSSETRAMKLLFRTLFDRIWSGTAMRIYECIRWVECAVCCERGGSD